MGDAADSSPDLAAAIQGERRLDERHRVHWPMLLSWTTPSGSAVARTHTIDLSFSGARVAVDHNFGVGEKVACRLSVQPWHGNSAMFDVDVSAQVIHCAYSSDSGGFDVGLHFLGFAGDGKERFAKAVQALQRGVSVIGRIVRSEH